MNERAIQRFKIVVAVGCLLIIALFSMNLYLATISIPKNLEIDKLQKEIEKLDYDNSILQAKIDEAESYRVISQHAKELGFVDPTDKDFVILK